MDFFNYQKTATWDVLFNNEGVAQEARGDYAW